MDRNQVARTNGSVTSERSQKMAAALSSYARALTFENRSRRNLYRLAGLTPKLRDRVFEKLLLLAFIVCFLLPFAGSVTYFLFIVTPQYASEVRFVVRSAVPLLSRDRYSGGDLEPQAKIVQDTAVLLNYLESPAIVNDLDETLDIRLLFARPDIDPLSRLNLEATQEELLEYWKGRYSVSVSPKSGIVELEIQAFTPEEAHTLLQDVLTLAEMRVNNLNSGMWENLLQSAQNDVETATSNLEELRVNLREIQNDSGIFNVEMSAESIMDVLTALGARLAELQSEYSALQQSMSVDSPQLVVIKRRIEAYTRQISEIRNQAAGENEIGSGNLAYHSKRFAKLRLDIELAEDRLASAIAELEKTKLVSALQLVYVDHFTEPTYPEKSKYPRLGLSIVISLLVCLTVWGTITGVIVIARKKWD